jgi:hypothetical protein
LLSAGFGIGALGSCNRLEIVNGSYSFSSVTGVGSGFSNSSGNSVIRVVEILSESIDAQRRNSGASIGSGSAN